MQTQPSATASSRDAYEGIFALVDVYFQSICTGDAAALESTFDPKCRLFADVDASRYEKSVAEYVQGVANRKPPRDLGGPFRMQALGVEVLGNIAMVRTRQQMLGFVYRYYRYYRDYLTLVRRDGQWPIANKTFLNFDSPRPPAGPAR